MTEPFKLPDDLAERLSELSDDELALAGFQRVLPKDGFICLVCRVRIRRDTPEGHAKKHREQISTLMGSAEAGTKKRREMPRLPTRRRATR